MFFVFEQNCYGSCLTNLVFCSVRENRDNSQMDEIEVIDFIAWYGSYRFDCILHGMEAIDLIAWYGSYRFNCMVWEL